ncbi:thymidine phosphorylase [Algicola sagamiensis]|uniref:thymidine phosphorylase n=1 Tax=Algicola sagamiensis TaxID=163869 RepID=UPI0003708C7A|nr:thymidine phosphorylase [Algicola sagamiensis]
MLLPQNVIQKKRDGQILTPEEIAYFVQGIKSGEVADAQVGAFTMAVYINGMQPTETANLMGQMKDSGVTLDWSDAEFDGPIVDKHSTGGVGDVVSLMLGPLVAACGGYVPMIAGRGLGHTGGTIDKLEAIPGYNTNLSIEQFRQVTKEVGVSIIGQTSDLAPVDKKIYAIRDVTATVASIPLITASILSKKLAAGLENLVMDVKFGSGAFMPTFEESRALARSIVDVAKAYGTPTTALLTNMNQVLAHNAGNALEVKEAVEFLMNQNINPMLKSVTVALGAEMLVISGICNDIHDAEKRIEHALTSGKALEVFSKMVAAHGGPIDFVERYDEYLTLSEVKYPVYAQQEGFVQTIDVKEIGMSVVQLKGGRAHPDQELDLSVGIEAMLPVGAPVQADTPLCYIRATNDADAQRIAEMVRTTIKISAEQPSTEVAVIEKIS